MPDIVILGNSALFHHARPLMEAFGERLVVDSDWRPSAILAHRPDLVITYEASNPAKGVIVAEMNRHAVATLLIMDGIQEWRNTWTRGRIPFKRPLNQPVLAHKVACLGRVDARIYESWGNVGKAEVTGAYRLDPLLSLRRPPRTEPITGRPLRLLVMTARTPGFTPQEVETTFQSLADLRDVLAGRQDIQVVWRVTRGLHKRLAVENTYTESTGKELKDVLAQVDAVITTPSTSMLEGMLFGHPVVMLDYHNVPHYVQAAWQITAQSHIETVLNDLFAPPLERMLFQDYLLNDSLSCREPALPRTIRLIEDMVAVRREQVARGCTELVFPHRMVEDPQELVSWPSEVFNLQQLYPHHPVFGRTDLTQMQSELDAAVLTVNELVGQVNILTARLHKIPGYLFVKKVSKGLHKWVAQH